ncbi:MAG: GGDEF domain-containing protein [Candidatus Thiodiazotropha taylori]|uniref:diguanylate cyclase n=1 Tax=Candidatus Thiodiazotropha taylori TaxID=2792791 RepID=A0A9E4N3S4_9GAMM|nr:GGDEF domain-containing protein [Candidatus Thiodiazotropha taylori]MCG7966593.1 GGDEF domain-containing protein [Candidatus Thiodiazotropha taylori]MCW4255567.1 GGDEF domain-containing protein [Candidatus Thiodiazotropha taylori]
MRSLFSHPRQALNDFNSIEVERRRIQYHLIFLIGAFILAAFALASYINLRYEIAYFLFGSLLAAIGINIFVLKTENHKIAAWLYSTVMLVQVVYLIISGGVEATGPLWTYPIVVIIISLLGHLHGYFLSLFVIALLSVLLGFGDSYGLTPHYTDAFKIRFIATLFALSWLVWSLEFSRAKAAALLNGLNQQILDISRTDQLTGLLNRRGLEENFNSEVNRSQRVNQSFSLALMDIDDFKAMNDRYGHLLGDEILKQIANVVQSQIRNIDTLARWGGEEFAILLDKSSLADAAYIADKVRKAIQELNPEQSQISERITISIGVAEYQPGQSMLELFDAADNALYLAKRCGKNCVRTTEDVARENGRPDLSLV